MQVLDVIRSEISYNDLFLNSSPKIYPPYPLNDLHVLKTITAMT